MFDSASAVVNGKTTNLPNNTAIADTAATLALVSDQLCQAIYDAIPGSRCDSQSQGYTFPANSTTDKLPKVTIAVGDSQFRIPKGGPWIRRRGERDGIRRRAISRRPRF